MLTQIRLLTFFNFLMMLNKSYIIMLTKHFISELLKSEMFTAEHFEYIMDSDDWNELGLLPEIRVKVVFTFAYDDVECLDCRRGLLSILYDNETSFSYRHILDELHCIIRVRCKCQIHEVDIRRLLLSFAVSEASPMYVKSFLKNKCGPVVPCFLNFKPTFSVYDSFSEPYYCLER